MAHMNDVAKRLESAKFTAPYLVEKERYQMAIDEINRLQSLLDQFTADDTIGQAWNNEIRVYDGDIWHADESDDCVRIFRGALQIIKAPKYHPLLEPYWPDPVMIKWIIQTLNDAELRPTMDT